LSYSNTNLGQEMRWSLWRTQYEDSANVNGIGLRHAASVR